MIQSIMCIICSGILWRLGGDGHKWCRAIGVPTLIVLTRLILAGNWWCILYAPLLWLMLSGFSYGLTAPVHRLMVWFFGSGADGSDKYVEFCTRIICGFFWGLPSIVFVVLPGNDFNFSVYYYVMVALVGLFGITKDVRVSEIGTGMAVALAVLI